MVLVDGWLVGADLILRNSFVIKAGKILRQHQEDR